MKIKLLFVAFLIMVGCNNKKKADTKIGEKEETSEIAVKEKDVELEIYDFEGLSSYLNKKDDKVYIINFWATWCAPCVKELPYFEEIGSKYKNENVEIILVSLDFPHLYDSKLKPYIKDKELKSKVVALNDDDMNTWIPKVSEDWSGAIPATVIYKNDKRSFYEKSFTYEELEKELKQFLN
ncbi:TlpA family protein disulfide reductase [Seonamhaeicola sp. MEBiC1930]|uniref:TlpA disulfide reductase family protein n=1 Tax=Seonamhaeicola sp. MEBiC01930 TaxID=2976768 RepID=UPI0032513490